jgi:glycosyltransferase involved in cell wall biosynthesis
LNLLILNTHLPIFPGGGGVEYLTNTRLSASGVRVGLVSMVHSRADLEKTTGLTDAGITLYLWKSPWIDVVPPAAAPSLVRRLHERLRAAVDVIRAWPDRPADTIVYDGCFRNMAPGLRSALAEQPWDAVAVVESSSAAMIDYLPRPPLTILAMHDIRSVLYERQAQASRSAWRRWRLRRQARRYFAFERDYCRRYDLVTTVSLQDAAWVREHYRHQRVITVPLPVDAEYFAPHDDTSVVPGRIVFTGLMSHPPNADAARYFAHEVFPIVRRAVPEAEFYVVGRHPTPDVAKLGALSGVHVTGDVPDIRPYLAEAAVVVVPLRYGSGSRQKILEAWCMEKCVVSTTIGAEGLEYRDGANLSIADDVQTMATSVARAIQEPEFRDALRHGGRGVATRVHEPSRVAADYQREIAAALVEVRQRESPMRVALDLRWIVPGLAGGLENLARSFIRELLTLDRHNAYTIILPGRCRFDFDLTAHEHVRVVTRDSLADSLVRWRRRLARAVHARFRLDYWESPDVLELRFARSLDAEIAYSLPGYIQPDLYPLRQVVMVPDIQHEYFPEFFSEQALEERTRLYHDAVRRADHICAISEFTRQTLIDRFGVPPEKVTAIPLAADPIFTAHAASAQDAATLGKYGLEPGSYFYFPGHTWLHKNHRTAIEGLRILRDKHGRQPALICTGGPREAQDALERQIDGHGLRQQVRFLGYCPHDDLPALYRGAVGLVFPSLFEGFGIPVLEAMASGCPVVCSRSTSLPEIGGDAPLFIDPTDAEACADAMNRLLCQPDLRAELRTCGLRRAPQFSWRRHTWDTIGVFYRVHRQLSGTQTS